MKTSFLSPKDIAAGEKRLAEIGERNRREREAAERGRITPPSPKIAEPVTKPDPPPWQQATFTAEQLRLETFPPLSWFLPDIIPAEGVTLLCSRPKFGKSWLALDACIAATANRFTLGEIKTAQGDVLYLALEDSKRRLQRRITKLLPTFSGKWPEKLTATAA
jgi:hypothetical protein